VVLQGVLGGLRVVLFKDQIGIFHATLAQLFFALLCAIALFTSRRWQSLVASVRGQPASASFVIRHSSFRWLFPAATGLILLQLILGATMRHQHAGLAIPDFPLAYGKLWPATNPDSVAAYNQQRLEVTSLNPITSAQIVLQMVHRIAAVGILAAVAALAWITSRRFGTAHALSKLSLMWLSLILLQAALGAATIWSNKAADVATLHVLGGAISLALGSLLSIFALMISTPSSVPAAATGVAASWASLRPTAAEHAG
jgi:cytochrome c oxidase assembly protein subunit 15